ncbi:MAG TPA: hypothetical protein VN277_04900 [Acidiferrobacterales bacterium]|nr:hypothetical protein [Acidiferrobacterales bacterium]
MSRAEAYVDTIIARPRIYWVDDHQVLFQGFLKAEDINKNNQRRALLFDVRTKRVEDRGVIGGGLCYHDGYVRYGRYIPDGKPKEGESRWIAGRFGQERPVFESRPPQPEGKLFDADWECRPDQRLPPLPAGLPEFENGRRWVLRLRPEHGFLEYASAPEGFIDYPVRLIPPGAQAKDGYPIAELRGYPVYPPGYYPFKQAYWLQPSHPEIPTPLGREVRSWWLYPDGKLEAVHRAVRRSSSEPNATVPSIPTRAGYYLIKPRNFRDSAIGQAGLYRYSDSGEHLRVLRGEIGGWAVSPDGCRLAVGLDEREVKSAGDAYVLHAIELCEAAKQ